MKSSERDNTRVDKFLEKIDSKYGEAHWGDRLEWCRSYSFEFNNGNFLTVTKHYRKDKKSDYYIVRYFTQGNSHKEKEIRCTNKRGEKLYNKIVELFKSYNNPPYKNWIY